MKEGDWATLVDTKEASLETGSEVEDGRRVETAEEFDAEGVPKINEVEEGELDEMDEDESYIVEVIGGAELLGICVESSARTEENGTVDAFEGERIPESGTSVCPGEDEEEPGT